MNPAITFSFDDAKLEFHDGGRAIVKVWNEQTESYTEFRLVLNKKGLWAMDAEQRTMVMPHQAAAH